MSNIVKRTSEKEQPWMSLGAACLLLQVNAATLRRWANLGLVRTYTEAMSSDTRSYGRFFHQMLEQGIYLPPSQFEATFVSTAHTAEDLASTVIATHKAFAD